MKNYYRVMLGKKSVHADESFKNGFIGADYKINQDLAARLPEDWRSFNKEFIPVYLDIRPDKTKIAAGLACGSLWMVSKGIKEGDVILSPDGKGCFRAGEVSGGYSYHSGEILPHRRTVHWFPQSIEKEAMSSELKKAAGAMGNVITLTPYHEELERLIGGPPPPPDGPVEDPFAFVIEKHLEEFLVKNWEKTELGKDYYIFEEDGERVGQQYPTDTGPVDILAVSKDKKVLLVVELKKGRASDAVVGQIQRYMGYVMEVLAEKNQVVKGVIIALEDDLKLRRALIAASNIEFYKYQVSFKLLKA